MDASHLYCRFVPVVPLMIPHKSVCDTTLGGHMIPKGTPVWPNVWALHHNEDIWGDPYTFRPERFLDDQGQLVAADHPNRVCVLTFGAGPRVCVGEPFAMSRMFLILAHMMKYFQILPPNIAQPPFDCNNLINGIALMAPAFQVCLKSRNHHE